MKVSYDKWYPVVQPLVTPQQDVFIKRIEKQDAERALQVQIDNTVKKFHQYEYEIYEFRMKQITLNIQINNLKREIDKLV
jgi:hypothetical protein|tara:strand:+ start:300 stop:539 length:240 start_codon:yes stop_codon:yes gene_type:complete